MLCHRVRHNELGLGCWVILLTFSVSSGICHSCRFGYVCKLSVIHLDIVSHMKALTTNRGAGICLQVNHSSSNFILIAVAVNTRLHERCFAVCPMLTPVCY